MVTMIDLGTHYKFIVNEINAKTVDEEAPNLPVARILWDVKPPFEQGVRRPKTNIIAEINIIFLRPNLSDTLPAKIPPKIAPNITEDVINPIIIPLSMFQSSFKYWD